MTSTALISDIHGNAWALDRVLREIDRIGVERIVCLGDIAVLGPNPSETTSRVRELAAVTVRGNVDAWLDPSIAPEIAAPPSEAGSKAMVAWARSRLSPGDMHWLTNLPMNATLDLGAGYALHAFHGTPSSCDGVISATTTNHELAEAFVITNGFASVIAGGHTHVPLLRWHAHGVVVNPGSVGLPGVGPGAPGLHRNRDVDWADFAIITIGDSAHPAITFHRIALDVNAMIEDARTTDMPEFAWWAARWRSTASFSKTVTGSGA
ncbi:MAG: metallophosphoesterase family protein [Thermomicrobiales bacterium]